MRPLPVIARASSATLAGAALLAVTVAPAVAAEAETDPDGRRWQDGDYTIQLAGIGGGSGAADGASGEAVSNVSGTFFLEIESGSGSAPATITYTFVGDGVSAEGTYGTGSAVMEFHGAVIAEDGYVYVETTDVDFSYMGIPVESWTTDSRYPLEATGASCGMIDGRWQGMVESLEETAATQVIPGGFDVWAHEVFVAGSSDLGGSFGDWAEHRTEVLEQLYDAADAIAGADADAQLEIANDVLVLVRTERDTVAGFDGVTCSGYGMGGAGVSSALPAILSTLSGVDELSPQALDRVLTAAAEAGALPVDAALTDALFQRIGELSDGATPADAIALARSAAMLGDAEYADSIIENSTGWEG